MDFDYVTLSSLNRHATAGLNDVGTPKVICIEKALRKISRHVDVDSRIELWRKEDSGALLAGVDWVVGTNIQMIEVRRFTISSDAIDNIQTKVDLLKYCHDHNIKVRHHVSETNLCNPNS